ncbi:MAG TPA: hypothetical protein VF649_08420 [Sphingomonas sp.]|uniref:hypothetical protein n=1 Tax=Sphingomonas sp. TaxID=28214 RepID=UPI002ED9590E
MGARWDAARDEQVAADAGDDTVSIDRSIDTAPIDMDDAGDVAPPRRVWGRRIAAVLPVLLALGWLGYVTLSATAVLPLPPIELSTIFSVGLVPLCAGLLLYLVIARGGHGEARRFAAVATDMRRETRALETALARMGGAIADQNRLLADQAGQLMALGDEAASRIGSVRAGFARDTAAFVDQGQALARATDAARVDLGVILADMPRIDAQIRSLAERLRDAGLGAHEQVGMLDAQLVAITTHAQEADQIAGAATQRLAAHLARIEGVSDVAAQRIDAAGTRMAATADLTLDQAAQVLDDLRKGLAAEQAALTAIVTGSHTLLGTASTQALAAAQGQVDLLESRLAAFAERIAREGAAVQTLAGSLSIDLDRAANRFETLGQDGGSVTLHLMERLDQARQSADAAAAAVDGGAVSVDRLIGRADRLTRAMDVIGTALQGADFASSRIATRVDQTLPVLEGFADIAGHASDALERSGEAIDRNRAALDDLVAALARTDADTQALVDAAAPALLDAVQRVRSAADDAAEHARAAFAAIGPDAGARLARASAEIVDRSVAAEVDRNLEMLTAAAARAADAAAAASERLVRQLLAIAETTATVEARVTETRAEAAAADEADFAGRVALLIESLNSTAIDMTRILSSEVADTAWAAYLRGDRGVFTRRAVRLLDHGEARAIAGHYGADEHFHDQVNRYIHDFEAMLRRVLASRDGHLLGVTLLSSDMGKLYVALAQAIERLRA